MCFSPTPPLAPFENGCSHPPPPLPEAVPVLLLPRAVLPGSLLPCNRWSLTPRPGAPGWGEPPQCLGLPGLQALLPQCVGVELGSQAPLPLPVSPRVGGQNCRPRCCCPGFTGHHCSQSSELCALLSCCFGVLRDPGHHIHCFPILPLLHSSPPTFRCTDGWISPASWWIGWRNLCQVIGALIVVD